MKKQKNKKKKKKVLDTGSVQYILRPKAIILVRFLIFNIN